MTKEYLKTEDKPRFTEDEVEIIFAKLANICASIEAQWCALMASDDSKMSGRHLDAILVLAQVGGFIADHAGEDCSYYGDVFRWLEIPKGGKS